MSEWYYQQDRRLGGPISFTRLARLVTDEELSEVDLVCRAGEVDWLPVSSIVGLRQTCEVLSGQREYVAPVAAEVNASNVEQLSAEELRKRRFEAAYRRAVNGSGDPDENNKPISRRDALLVYGPLGLLTASLVGTVVYQLTYDPWEHRTYKRDSDSDD